MLALNVAISMVISYGITKLITHFQEAKQATQEMAQKSKETTDSLKDLVDQYKELGDKSGWDTDDFEQARDINDEILDLLKGQSSTMDEKLDKLDLENGKYEEQLNLLNDIAYSKANTNLADQKTALIDVAQDTMKTSTAVHLSTSKEMAKLLADNNIGTLNGGMYNLGNYDPNNADSVLDFYDKLNKALELLGNNFTNDQLVESKFDDFFSKQINKMSDQVKNVRDAQDFVQDSHRDTLKAQRLDELQTQKDDTEKHQEESERKFEAKIDTTIKQSERYQQALAKLESIEEEYTAKGVDIYGNISNFDRGRLDWNDKNIKKFQTFYDEFNEKNPDDKLRDYSTILGSDDPIYEDDETSPRIAFTPMLQTEDGLIPLTDNELYSYLEKVADTASEMEGGLNAENILKVDKEGFDEIVNGVKTRVHGMIAAVEGEMKNGSPLSAADVSAIAGWDEESLKEYYGKTSKYVGYSMHDVQSAVEDTKKEIKDVYEEMEGDARKSSEKTADDYVTSYSKIKDSVDYLRAGVSHFDASKLESLLNSDGNGLSDAELRRFETLKEVMSSLGFDTSNTDDVAAFVDILKQLGVVAPSAAEATQQITQAAEDAATQVKNAKQAVDDMQSAYQACKSAVDEYNKTGFVSVDTLQKLSELSPEYLTMLQNEDGQLSINTQSAKKLTAATIQTKRAALLANTLTQIQQTNTLASAQKVLGEAQATIGNATQLLTSALYQSAEEGLANNGSFEEMQAVLAAGHQIISNYQTLDQLWQDLGNHDIDKIWGKTTKSTKAASKSVTDAASAFDTLTKAMNEYNQYGYVSADTMKSLMGLEDKFTSCLVKNGNKLEINANEFRKLVEQQLAQEAASKKSSKSSDELKRILGYLDKNVKSETISFEQLTDAIKGYGTAMDEAKEKTDAIKSAFSDLYDVGTKKKDNDFGFLDADSIEKKYQAIRDLYDKTDLFTNPAYKDALNPETGEIDYNSDAFKQMFADHLAELATTARKTGGAAGEYLAQGFEDAAAKISQNVMSIREYIDGIGSSLQYATDRIDHFQSGFSDISDIVKEYNTYGGLSIDNYQKLMSLDDNYIKCLSLEGNQLKFNTEEYKKLFIAKLNAMADEYDKAKETQALAARLRELAEAVGKSADGFTMATDSAKNFEDTLSNIKSLLSDLIGVFEQFNTDKSNDLKIQGDAWLEVIDKRIDALNEQNDAQERAIELSKAQDALEKAKANKTVHVYHAGGSGFEWEADESAVRDAQSTLNDTIRKNRKEDEIERLNKLKKAVQENNELIGSSFEDYEKKKKYLAEFDKMTYDDMISYNENWKNSILGNMKSTQVVTNVNEIITKIEKLVTTLETLNNVLTAIRTHGASTDGGGLTGLFSKNGLFGSIGNFISNAKTKGLETAAKEALGTFLDNTGAMLEANENNPIVKAATGLWDKLKGIFSGKIVATGVEAGVDETLATLAKKEVVQKGACNLLTRFGGAASTEVVTEITKGVSSALPVIGPLIAVVANNAVQQLGKISKENTKIWSDKNSTTGEKIVSSVGNVLYHLSPVEGWDKSVQYAKMAAEGEGLWNKIEYGAKSLYYATGLGTMLDNIWGTIKSILKVFGVKFKDSSDDVSTSSSVSGKKGIGSWKIWPWNWGKKAKGDKKIKKSAPYNVDEEGDEIIVRKPQTGRMTYLEKGDGVIPANETENLMTIGKNPLKWLTENVGKILGASAAKDVVEGKVDEGAVTKASQVLASSVVNTFSSAWNSVKMSTEDLIDSMNDSFQGGSTSVPTAAGTILSRVKTLFGKTSLGKLLGSFNSGVSGSIAKSAKEYSSTSELLSGTKSKTIDTMNKMRSTFEKTWASVAKETGVSKDKITSISSEMFSKMETLVNQTYDAIDSNAGISSDQLNNITKSLFQSMQSIYTSGWNAIYATSTGMSQETANTLNSAYKSSSDSCTQAMDTIRNTMVGSWEQCGGGVQNLANGTYQTLSNAWAGSSKSANDMLEATRACFDTSWGAVEQGVSNLANNPKDRISTAWAEITSKSNATFGAEGTLKTDADNAWKNVEPGTNNLADNMKWVMDQSYTAIKNGCSDAVDEINRKLNTTADSFKAVADATDAVNKKASDSEETAKKTGHAWYEWVLNPVGTLTDTVTKYNKEDSSKNGVLQNVVHTVTHPISSLVDNAKTLWKKITGHASGIKSASKSHLANVDELGPELLVRKPQSGRYTYLETGDGVVPADITSKLFEMGGNPNKWFSEQMAKYGSQAITTKSTGNTSFSTGNIVINSPVGNSEDLVSEIKKNFSTRMAQEWNKR